MTQVASARRDVFGDDVLSPNVLDHVSLSKIVEIRDVLIEKQSRGEKVFRLESGTPAYNLFPAVAEAIVKAVRDNKTFYTEGTGIRPLREAIAAKLQRKNGITHDCNATTVFAGQGGMGTLYCVITALCGSDDTIICPSPVWESVSNIAKLSGANVVTLDLKEELGFNWDIEELAATVEQTKPRLVIIVNPGNPTGGVFPKADTERLFELVREHKLFVLEDLAYEDITYDDDFVNLTEHAHATNDPELYRQFIPVYTMSKSQNYSGLRIGYTHLPQPQLSERFRKALLYTTNGINSLAQWGAVEALDPKHDDEIGRMRDGYRERRDALYAGLENAGVFRLPGKPKGAFYLFPHINRDLLQERLGSSQTLPSTDSDPTLGEWMSKFILQEGIGSIAGTFFGPSAGEHIRFAYTCSVDDCRAVAARLTELFG
ncbi:MAG: aminotransferase class I/II-fold pyridoxal phosphate-dependent enzyme [candidate division Zixibacteria bacterium]|nr:aminotransferase class I/II-fold pyridoxal phosphate-dependent enzyme [candidate division Zixibacteria bacterium]